MIATREEFVDWKNNPITQELFQVLMGAAEGYTAEMVNRITPDTNRDQFIRGAVNTIGHIAGWEPPLVEPNLEVVDEA